MRILIKNGRVIDPASNTDEVEDILVEDNRIFEVARNITTSAEKIIDATHKIVMPGIVDMHVHLREPGEEHKETVASGTRAGLKGGVTTVLAMPNTKPSMDSPENVKLLRKIIDRTAKANVFIAATITKERLGKELTQIAQLKKQGVIAISDDGASVEDSRLLQEAFKIAKKENLLVICHCEDKSLSQRGVVNLGFISTCLGLRGIPKESEYKRVQRDIQIAQKAGASIHIAHVSCQESVEIIAQAKKKKVKVTCETAPHYFSLTEEATLGYDTNMKTNPPLRTREDVKAIKKGLKNGIIDVIASDHAPHTENEKDIEFEYAEFGVIGLETILAVSVTELVNTGLLDWLGLVRKLCLNPAKILGIDKGTLKPRKTADIVVISPDKEWRVEREGFVSKCKNSAFINRKLKGVVEYTICNSKLVYQA